MKKITGFAILLMTCYAGYAQNKLVGDWEGKLMVGTGLRLVLHVQETDGKLAASLASPDQGVSNVPASSVALRGDSVLVDISISAAKYTGVLKNDDTVIIGNWKQGGASLPLTLIKTDKPSQVVRPQTPKPPFTYQSEDVSFTNADKSITYGATITIPKGIGKHPALLLVTGSGPQNRDEELAGHKPFAVIADYLTDKGYIVLRVDDRGVGKTTGDRKNATSADFAKDASAAVDYLRTRPEVNLKKMGILGHSEGGIIAPMVANSRKDIDFIILMAGPGEKIYELMEDQNAAIMEAGGVSADIVADYRKVYRGMEQAIITGTSEDDVKQKMQAYIDAWSKTAKDETKSLVGYTKEEKDAFVNEFVKIYNDKWFNYFLKYDPQPQLKKLSCKVLAINGSKDVQVVAKPNLEAIRKALAQSKTKEYEVLELPGLNHLFQQCNVCTVAEYGTLSQTISPEALQTIKDWMDKHVK